MRKILLFFISLCAFVFSGCSKEENTVVPNVDSQELVAVPQDPVVAVPSEAEQTTSEVPGSTAAISNGQMNLASQEEMIVPIAAVIESEAKQPISAVKESAEEAYEQNVAISATQAVHADTMTTEVQEQ